MRIQGAESLFYSGTSHLMGFRLRNQGLQIVLDRDLTPFVRREVAGAVRDFLARRGLARSDVTRWILHPGGRKIIEAMTESLGLARADLAATERVLSEHGNMSSVTVLFVLEEVLRTDRSSARERRAFWEPLDRASAPSSSCWSSADTRRESPAMIDLRQRAREPELLDLGVPAREMREEPGRSPLRQSVAQQLGPARSNRARDSRRSAKAAAPRRRVRVGDLLERIHRRSPRPLLAVGVDVKIEHLQLAPASVRAVVSDVRGLPFPRECFDVVMASHFLHHFDSSELPEILSSLFALARRALVINDLRRSRVPFFFGRVAFPVLFRSRVSVSDGLVSIRRGFHDSELAAAFQRGGHPGADRTMLAVSSPGGRREGSAASCERLSRGM